MEEHDPILGFGFAVVTAGPLLLGIAGILLVRFSGNRNSPSTSTGLPLWPDIATSALLYALAFNIVFFVQELFLVVPKALTPGLDPVLYHNNHDWVGDNALAELFQGTGALSILILGLAFLLIIARFPLKRGALHLFCIWMAFHGLMQSLRQIPGGAVAPQSDVGRAMIFLDMSEPAKIAAGLIALAATPLAAILLVRPLLSLAGSQDQVETPGARSRYLFWMATLPAIAAIALIVPFRMPDDPERIIVLPIWVTVIGIGWMQASAWCVRGARAGSHGPVAALVPATGLLLGLLLIFQFVLRPGIYF